METLPRIQFARTADAVSIAYYRLGKGPPLLHLFPHIASHLTAGWRVPTTQDFLLRLAEELNVIVLDWRGCGLSVPWSGDLTPDMPRADMLAVLDKLEVKKTNICAWGLAANYALDFAVKYPDRVSRLVFGEFNRGTSELRKAIVGLGGTNPSLAGQTLAAVQGGFSKHGDVAALAEVHAKTLSTDARFREMTRLIDAPRLLAHVKAPSLFVHASDDPMMPLADAEAIAAAMALAALYVVPGTSAIAVQSNDGAIGAILDFLLREGRDELVEDAPAGPLRPDPEHAPGSSVKLSHRQREVLDLIAQGKTNREIAEQLVLSARTVERHVAEICTRTGARNRTEAVAFVLRKVSPG